ncbi:MAG: hypothetical protein ACK4WD_08820 [Flavobacteriales bacterium]|jgi:hypothetical protein
MKGYVLFFIFGAIILSERASAQNYIRVDGYRELRSLIRSDKEKVGNFILQNQTDSIRKYFDVYYLVSDMPVNDAVSFYSYRERALINFFLDDSNQIWRDIDDDAHYFSYQMRVPVTANIIIPELTTLMSEFWIEFAKNKLEGNPAQNDKEELLLLYLKRIINDLVGFPHSELFSQDSINVSARNILSTMDPIKSRRAFVLDHILYEFEDTSFGLGFSLLPFGYSSFNTGLSEVFESGYSFNFDSELQFKRFALNLSVFATRSEIQKDVLLDELLWSTEGDASVVGFSGNIGYAIVDNRRLRIAPMAGINLTRATYIFADSTYSDNGEAFVQPHFGLTMDAKFRLKSRPDGIFATTGYHPRSERDCIYIRLYAGHLPVGLSNAFGNRGSITQVGLGVGYFLGWTRLRE